MTSRAEIAQALDDAGIGLKPTEFRPSTLGPMNAWPQVASRTRADGFFLITWAVYVVLPTDERVAANWFDDNFQTLWDAVQKAAYVDSIEPIVIPINGGDTLFALLITARSE